MELDWTELQARVRAQFRLNLRTSAHAPDHWERVRLYGLLLCPETGADPLVVRLFALLHDSQREDEGHDPEHGPRAAAFARDLQLGLAPEQLQRLMLACRDHERGYTVPEPTIGTCWDSDRLDLDRVGKVCDTRFMSTPRGRQLADMRAFERQRLARIRP